MVNLFLPRALRGALLLLLMLIHTPAYAWERLEAPPLASMRASSSLLLDVTNAGERLVAVGDQGVILLSDDQGVSWRQAASPVSSMLTAVSFSDARQGWAVGHDGVIVHSQDGGEQWQVQLQGNQLNQLRVEQLSAWLAQGGDPAIDLPVEELALYLDDAQVAQEEGPTQPLLDVWFADGQHGWALGAYGLLLHTVDGGQQWQIYSHRLPNPDRFHLNAILAVDRQLFIAGEAGVLFRSDDQGEHWQALVSPYQGSFFALLHQGEQLLALGLRGHLFASADRGDSWQPVALNVDNTLTGGVVADGQLFLTGLGGALLLGESPHRLQPLDASDRRSWSSAVRTADQHWLVVGEKGSKRLSAAGQEIQP